MSASRLTAALLVAVCMAGACREAPPPALPPPAALEWREVGSWSGTGHRQTESFEVSQFAMRLRWEIVRETTPGQGHLTVTLHSAVSGRPLQTLVDATGVTRGEALVADDLRPAHFVIEGEHAEWRLLLEQPYARTAK